MLLYSNRHLTNNFIIEQLGACGNILTCVSGSAWLATSALVTVFFFCSCLHSFQEDL